MKNILKNIITLSAFLFLMTGIQAYAANTDHDCKCKNKETCCVDKEHCAQCPDCKDCCKEGKHCSEMKGKACVHTEKASGKKACCKDSEKDCCKKSGKKKGKGTDKA